MVEGVSPIKKGKKSWAPAQKLAISDKTPGLRYRWCDKDQANLDKKLSEGWVFVDSSRGISAQHERPDHVSDGKPQQGSKEYRELVLMALDEETGQARDRYFQERTDQQTSGLKREFQRDAETVDPRAKVYGKIVIE